MLNDYHRFTNNMITTAYVRTQKKATQKSCLTVGILGLEPRMAGPESAVLPLHHIPMRTALISVALNCVCKGSAFL